MEELCLADTSVHCTYFTVLMSLLNASRMSPLLISQASRIRENLCRQDVAGRADNSLVSCKALKHSMIDILSLVMLCVPSVPIAAERAEFSYC